MGKIGSAVGRSIGKVYCEGLTLVVLLYALGGALLEMNCNQLPREIKRELEEEAAG